MPVKVRRDGIETPYMLADGGNHSEVLRLRGEGGSEITVEVPLTLDQSFADKTFDIYFLFKRNLKESEIFEVYLKSNESRIGWVIPTLALSSTLHDFSEHEHFLKYAYIAVRNSLQQLDESTYSRVVDGSNLSVAFSDIFHESTAILVISRETLGQETEFNIHRATPSLLKYGYAQLGQTDPDQLKLQKGAPTGKRLYIEPISKVLKSEELISEILNHSFATEDSPAFKFFLIYQLFELLIDEVYRIEQNKLVQELVAVQGDSGKTKDCLEKLRAFMSEKQRLWILVNQYCHSGPSSADLKAACNSLLTKLGRDAVEFPACFYAVRNFVFHQYRDFPVTEEASLDAVIEEILDILPGILCAFNRSVPPQP